jgi:hypothetical protein
MIEQLRPLSGQYNKHIVPVMRLLGKLRNEPINYINSKEINDFFKEYRITFSDILYLVEHEVLALHTELDSKGDTIYMLSYVDDSQDEFYDMNVLENAKTFLKDADKETYVLYNLFEILVSHYPVKEIPYVIDLLQYERVIKKVYVNAKAGQEYIA